MDEKDDAHTSRTRHGLYDPRFEHDSCGVSFVANIKGVRSHELVHTGLVALTNLEHRGATGAEPDTGDGAGILVQVPDRFLRSVLAEQGVADLPPAGAYAVGMAFLPADHVAAEKAQAAIENIVSDEGLTVVAWRDVPDPSRACLGATVAGRDAERSSSSSSPIRPARPASTSTARRSSPASASSTSSTPRSPPTSRRCRRARSSTRGC